MPVIRFCEECQARLAGKLLQGEDEEREFTLVSLQSLRNWLHGVSSMFKEPEDISLVSCQRRVHENIFPTLRMQIPWGMDNKLIS